MTPTKQIFVLVIKPVQHASIIYDGKGRQEPEPIAIALQIALERSVLDRTGTQVDIEANNNATVLLLSGEPIDEPVVGRGPFGMNTQAEIALAIRDFDSGRFGKMAS